MKVSKEQKEELKAANERIKKELKLLGIQAPPKHLDALAIADQLKVFDDLHQLDKDLEDSGPFTYVEYFSKLKKAFPLGSKIKPADEEPADEEPADEEKQ
jgi:cell division protein ZapA (FtsZ GTPase activity inhibitor)